MNLFTIWTNSAKKNFEFRWILDFLWRAENSKIALNRRHVVARPSSGENGSSAVVTSTQERNVLLRQ